MRRFKLAAAAAVVVVLATACGSGSDDSDGGQGAPAPGARSCSAWAGQMDESEQWAAAEELLANAKSADGTEGDVTPSTGTVRQFAADLGALCEQKPSDEPLATVADELYEQNPGVYVL